MQSVWLIAPETSDWAFEKALKVMPELSDFDPVLVETPHVEVDDLSPTTGFIGTSLSRSPSQLPIYGC